MRATSLELVAWCGIEIWMPKVYYTVSPFGHRRKWKRAQIFGISINHPSIYLFPLGSHPLFPFSLSPSLRIEKSAYEHVTASTRSDNIGATRHEPRQCHCRVVCKFGCECSLLSLPKSWASTFEYSIFNCLSESCRCSNVLHHLFLHVYTHVCSAVGLGVVYGHYLAIGVGGTNTITLHPSFFVHTPPLFSICTSRNEWSICMYRCVIAYMYCDSKAPQPLRTCTRFFVRQMGAFTQR